MKSTCFGIAVLISGIPNNIPVDCGFYLLAGSVVMLGRF